VRYTVRVSRFAIREATLADAEGIARAHTASWQTSYRGILPDTVLDRIDVGQRTWSRRQILRDTSIYHLVAYETTRGQIVGFCDAGHSRHQGRWAGEIYAIYLEHHSKRHGLGREMFERTTTWLQAHGMPSLIIWVLENNQHARRFYEAMGGRIGPRVHSRVGGFAVVELSYVWDRIS
jgi:GNAT superfamily N-acetyltransferase